MMRKRYKWSSIFVVVTILLGVVIVIGYSLNKPKPVMIEKLHENKGPLIQKVNGPNGTRDQLGLDSSDQHEKVITDFIGNELKQNHFIGTALIVKNGKVIFQKGYGYADKLNNRKNSASSLYQIASVQKGATGVMLMKLVQAGKISLNDKLAKYYPNIGYSSLVTLRQMLNMISGISLKKMPQKAMSEKQLVKYIADNVQVTPKHIGQQFYEPANFVLLAGIIQQVTQKSYYANFKQFIQKPLGLKNTYDFNEYNKVVSGRTVAYSSTNTRDYKVPVIEEEYQYTNELGTGNFYMTNGDLYKMLRSFITGGILNAKSTAALFTVFPPRNTYSSGLYHVKYMQPFKDAGIYDGYHFHGAEYGYETIGDISVDGKQAVILQTNNPNTSSPFNIGLDSKLYHFLITH
ncbi:serine hydrolase domain-containing protein [Liquorilactobacillus capillatus]|uniref:Beta-lactamase class C related penicillin binding protein n=1 Tax=Liquorilactobacillus capillatus DSM 19910 TaxID=1423731 RepID=A0A0R1LX23_9LACO|nr:serine hydrolase domain-containing protein [Liquorilactobacillus capillatus]KRL00262.1 Beta-lactamase class C related penicillin binding protein [Liquorilactobacillus capillatus DSM 19910]